MRTNYKLGADEFKAEVVATIKEVRKFVASNKVLEKEDEAALLESIKYLIDVNGDVNNLLQRWSRVSMRIYSLLTRVEEKAADINDQADRVWKEEYVRLVREETKDHLAKAIADTCVEYVKIAATARQYSHLVKLLERTYKLSENLLRVLEHLSNNLRQDNRDAKV